jgi:hypothetical protein
VQNARAKGRRVVRNNQTKQNGDLLEKWRKIMDTKRRVAHRQIREQGKPKHTLSEVRTPDGNTSAIAADFKEAATAHFTKVQTATIPATPEAVRDNPMGKCTNPMKLNIAKSNEP